MRCAVDLFSCYQKTSSYQQHCTAYTQSKTIVQYVGLLNILIFAISKMCLSRQKAR